MFVTQTYKLIKRLCEHLHVVHSARTALWTTRYLLACALIAIVNQTPAIAQDHERQFDQIETDVIERSQLPDLQVDSVPPLEQGNKKEEVTPNDLAVTPKAIPPKTSIASPLQRALKAYKEKRIVEAISDFEQAAQNNSFIARFLLAYIYQTGKGGVVNHRRAYDYYYQITVEFADADIQSSRQAPYVAHAFVQLARYMEAGVKELEIKADPRLARILFEKAAYYGDVEGQYQLGRFLIETGRGRNVKLGQRWLTRAAMKNNAKAQAYLGALYWQGDLVTRKQALALAWIEFARRNATGSVKRQVERLFEAVRYDMSPKQHKRAKLYIARLKTKYNVLWREEPMRQQEREQELLDGIILAEPPQGLDQEQLEAKGPVNNYPDAGSGDPEAPIERYGDGGYDRAPSSFGFQMFDYGGAAGQ